MSAAILWAWDNTDKCYRQVVVDANGKLIISDADPFTIAQATPQNLKHAPHGYYAAGPSWLPLAVDSLGKLLVTLSSLAKLDDIDDVSVPSPADGYFVYRDAATSLWKCRALLDADIPAAIARDTEVTTAVSDHAALTTGIHGLTIGARVYHNTEQAIPTATWTALAFNSERWDTDTIHDTVTNNSRLTCKTAGKYLIVGQGMFWNNAVGERNWELQINGTTVIAASRIVASAAIYHAHSLASIWDLSVNSYVEFRVYQDSGGDLNIGSGQAQSAEFMMQRVG